MTDVANPSTELSPERRKLLELRLRARQAEAAGPVLRPRARPDGTAPLSAAQARLWVLERMQPGSALYTIPLALRVRGPLHAEALRRALETIVHRHESLRTTFAEREGAPVQVVHPPAPLPLPVSDLATLSTTAREAEVRRRVDEDANTGFDLEAGPVFRASLLRLAEDEHVLLLCMHHIVADGWSMGVFARELGEAYAALREGREPGLPPLPVQYADFAAWQHEHLRGETLERLAAFWRRTLEGAPPALELPADRVRPAGATHAGRPLRARISPGLAGRLRELARGEDATLFHVLLAAYRTVLARHAGQDDVVIGTPTANRTRSAVEGLIGFFVNTVPLRGRVRPDDTFRALVRAEKAAALAAVQHGELPFDRIVDALRIERDPARNPVFQTMLTLQNARMDPVVLAGTEVTPIDPETDTARFDLTLDNYEEEDGGVRVLAECATDVFHPETAERIVRHFVRLLEEAVEAPDRPIATLAGADAEERALVIHGLNRTAAEYERDSSVHALFEAQAARTPGALALEYGDVRLTYAELDARANRLAARLRAAGVGAGSRVGVAMEGSAELPLALLGVLKAGAAYVPLDPAYPPERLAFTVADAGVSALLVRGEAPAALASFAGPVTSISVDPERVLPNSRECHPEAGQAEAEPALIPGRPKDLYSASQRRQRPRPIPQAIDPSSPQALVQPQVSRPAPQDDTPLLLGLATPSEDLGDSGDGDDSASFAAAEVPAEAVAYVVYTSGSTGTPKGIAIPHRAVVRMVRGTDYLPFAADERIAQLNNPSFDALGQEVWGALLNGAALVGIARETTLSPRALVAALRETRVTTAVLTTALFNLAAREAPDGFATLRHLIFAGEAADPGAVRAVLAAGGPGRLINGYGPAESATIATWHLVRDVPADAAAVPIGAPIANTTAYVLDDAGRPCGLGEPGEMWIGGDGLAHGYVGRPGLTAERFVPDFLSGRPGARLYRTGDRVRRREDGALEWLARLDAQVKVRGFRIEPAEVEAALRALPAVRDCAVGVREAAGGPRLVAWVVPADGTAPEAAGLRDALARRLPAYLVPSTFIPVDAIPLTANGKVDRAALPLEDGATAAYVPPREGTEARLADVWRELLGGGEVGAHDGFFDRGGHSLLAARLVSAVRGALGVELPMGEVFQAPRLDEMAARIDALRREGAAPTPDAAPRPRPRPDGTAPLSFAQQRLWVIDRMEPGSPAYNVPAPLRLRGALDAAALEAALNGLRERHEALRTTFAEREGEPVQVVHPYAPVALPLIDLSALPDAEREAEAARRADEDANTGFDLERGPLMRATLVRLSDDDHLLLWCQHHVVTDGWSLGVLRRELAALYAAARRGEADPLPPLPLQYADFAAWQREWMAGERLERAAAFWRQALAGAPPALEIPADHARPPRQSHRGAQTPPVRIPSTVIDPLRALAREEGTTLFAVLLAATRVVLARISGQDDVVIGGAAAGRTHAELEALAGFFANPLPLRTPIAGDPTFRALLRAERDTVLDAFAHQELPFERLVEELRVPRDPSRHPVFQATLGLRDEGEERFDLDGVRAETAEVDYRQSKADLELDAAEADDGVRIVAHYAADLFAPAAAGRIAAHLARVLEQAAAAPDQRLSRIRLTDGTDETARLTAWGQGERDITPNETLHGLIAAQAARTPDAPALAWDGGALTYAELEARASALARRLRRMGIGPERVVGMMLEPSPEAVVAILGILKAGGAYLPLDPAHPDARLTHALADSRAMAVVARTADRRRIPRLPVVRVDGMESFAAMEHAPAPDDPPPAAVSPDHLAYVIYTSGSTGTPKGVAVAHGPAALHARAAAREYGLEAGDRCLVFSALTFDASVEQVFATFAAGGCVIPREAEVWGPAELARRVERLGATAVLTSTGYLAQLAHDGAALAVLRARLRLFTAGGEEMRPDTVRAWYAAPGRARLLNLYGPTEGVVAAAFFPVPEDFAASRPARVPIGRPIPGKELRVLDEAMRDAGIGVPGELRIGGVALARGYLGRPALTAERFVPDPSSTVPGARLYRTGDRARWKADSTLEFLGRADGQVKVRGYRIEPGEIEAALRAHPAVADCVVDARPDASGSLRLAAYVVGQDGAVPEAAELRAHLAARVPEYMVPAAFVPLAALPLTPAGKVDRRALPELEMAGAAEYVAPATADEAALAAIWTELLRVDRVGARDDFVALGGHSLLGARMVSRIAAALGVALPLRAVFEAPTVRALARRVAEARAESGPSPAGPIPRADRDGPLPASFAQERMWFLQQLDPASAAYNVPEALRLRGSLDAEALRRALAEVVRRHEVLRTVFAPGEDGPVQVILSPDAFGWEAVDLSHLPADEAEAEAIRRARAEAAAPFDLARGPVLRAVLVRLGDDDHLLSLVMHHVAGDAWSREVLNRELATLYAAFRRGGANPLPVLEVQYADFAAWQRAWLRGDELERQAAYWRARLAGAPAVLELPTDRPRPAVQDPRGTVHAFRIPADTASQVRALAAREGATPFMVLLAAFAVVLHRLSGDDDLVIGSPVAHRPRPELEPLIGFFSNTLPLRADLSGEPPFRALLRRLRETTLEAHAHQDLPFEKLVDELKAERSLSHTPLFQVMFTLQHAAAGTMELEGVMVADATADAGTSRYDLTLILSETPDGALDGYAEYATALWDEPTIARLAAHLESVVRAATAEPDTPVSALDLLSAEEREQVVDGFNRTETPGDAPLVHHLVTRQAGRTPDAVAVEFGGEAVTYAELEARASRLANRLARVGVGPDARVAVAMERSIDMVVSVLAVLKAGGCYVAVDPNYPAERIAYMLADSRAAVVLTNGKDERTKGREDESTGLAERLASTGAVVVSVDAEAEAIARESAEAPAVDLHPENLLYVLYTSGSTGRPKGAALPHRALANVIRWQTERWGGDGAARTLQFASLSFDVSFQEIFSTWAGGGTLVLIADDTRRDAEALIAHLREHRIERLFIPFAGLQSLAEAAEAGDAHLPHLREVITAGEALRSTPQLRAFFRANPQARLENQYGPSETHVISAHPVDGDPDAWPALPPIGAAVANTRLYVLDARMQPVPVGVPGELYAGGANLARGYLGRPALTAGRFVPDPFGPAGSRLYRTGDRVRWRECESAKVRKCKSGGDSREAQSTLALSHSRTFALEYVGRTDFQVKVRGFRVEPGEIEAALTEHPSVVQAAVTARGEGAARRLAAYVVPAAAASPSVAELRAHLAARLPEHMVPGAWRILDALPLTPSGKVDRRALPEPDEAPADEAGIPPRTPAERMVADAWAAVLGARPGAHDNFFALGGHSLAATQVVARIRRAFGIELPLRALFESPTVAALAARAADARRGSHLQLPPLVPVKRGDETPLSFAQQRFWFVERLGAAGSAYHVPLAVTLRGDLDAAALRAALDGLVARHEALRTTFHLRGVEPVQAIAPHLSIDLPLHDLTTLSDDAREAETERISREEWTAPFDLARGPLLRARLLRLAADEHRLLLTFHHIVCDAWSLGVAFRELGALYAAAREGRPASLPPLPVQYADYAVWQRQRLDGEGLRRELDFWRARLQGAAVLDLPTDHPRPAVQSFRGATVPFRLGAEMAARVGELARQEGATPFMVLLAAFSTLLARWSGTDDVVVGSPVAGRVPEETEPLVGVFVNTLALRTDLSGSPTFREVLARVREGTLDAWAHQEVPFERLVEELKVERSLDRHPLFQVIFTMHAGGLGAPELPGLAVDVSEGDTATSKVDLVLGLTENGDELAGGFQYASELFDEATIRRMASHLAVLLDAALADPARPVRALPLMPPDEAALLESFHGPTADYPRDLTIPALFEAQAARTPDAIALRWNGEALAYSELNARANRLARRLRTLGVGPEVRVAVCMERTPELIVALFAVLKAGGAYVPVDPGYPAERIAYMLDDSGAPVLLTHARLEDRLGLGAGGPLPQPLPQKPLGEGSTSSLRVIRIDADWEEIAQESPDNLPVTIDPANLAYAIYTSGSTGWPKGVQITHRSAAVLLHWLRETVTDDDRRSVLGSTSVSFDVSIAEIFGTLCWGGTLVLVENALSLANLPDGVEVSLASMVPSAAAELLRLNGIPGSVRTLNLGGEALPHALAQALFALTSVSKVVNLYGPTEDTTYSTFHQVREGDERVYVGRPVANTRAYVLDRDLRPVPVGVPGELYLASDGLARGYHRRPALTAERFVPDPFSEIPGARMYRVGDRVRWKISAEVRECGSALDPAETERTDALAHPRTAVLEYLGRLDHQVKIRGHRIEIGEVEAVLARHPAVRDAAVVAREDVPGDVRLAAYVVARDPARPAEPAELRAFLKERLPEYMVPAAWVALEALPLSPNGKVDRLRLRAPGEYERASTAAHAPPRTATEQAIARVWEEVLGIARVGVDENFFEIGGHSLLLARMEERLREALRRPVTVVDLFRHPTVAALAAYLAPRGAEDGGGDAPVQGRGRGAGRREMMRKTRR